MWRLMGAALLTGGGLWMGLQAAAELERRAAALESWADALALLEGELAFRLPDLPWLLEELARRAPGLAGEVMAELGRSFSRLGEESFEQLWTEGISRGAGPLDAGDLEPLYRLGTVLGRCGWEEQRRAAERTRTVLEHRAAHLREELSRKGRAYGALGLSLGAFMTILLL